MVLDMSAFVTWFDRCVGKWESQRRYLYNGNDKPDNITTHFEIKSTDDGYAVHWGSDRNTGEMNFVIEGDVLKRDIGYYTNDPTSSKMTLIDGDTVVFQTTYGGVSYREEIRLLHNDTIRLRQTVGFKGDKVNVVGQYYETKVE